MSVRARSRSMKGTQEEEEEKLIERPAPPPALAQQVLSGAFGGAAHLANLLPTGTLLAFQLLTPVFTNNGSCDGVTRAMTQLLLLLLAASSFLACFTDSFPSPDGKVYHGLATPSGMWLFDYPTMSPPALPDLAEYRIRFIDFVHGVLSVLVFGVVVMKDKNVVACFYPQPEHETQEILSILPLGVGVICSLLSVVFPTRRHGIGYPVTNRS
ncbi:unnamed protein product [Spirodela intermedia]|uniref:Uncharacterized protein n=1 Tax=Spirodela intermedia TaxID=51605 RepID=A0A7I8KGD8_SPIIN|nr:unnamed protein product [Spirodela intermedia]